MPDHATGLTGQPFLVAVAVIVVSANVLGATLTRFRQPAVVGEILAGLLLGPSFLGWIWPAAQHWLFPAEVREALRLVAELGLVTFVFMLACELRLDVVGSRRRSVVLVTGGALVLPLVAGTMLAVVGGARLIGPRGDTHIGALFFGLAVSVTALPVLARIACERGLLRTPVGELSLTCAAFGDGLIWAALSVLLGLTAGDSVDEPLVPAAGATALLLVMITVVRPTVRLALPWLEAGPHGERMLVPALLCGAYLSAGTAELIGIHPVVGAFAFGLLVPRRSPAVGKVAGAVAAVTSSILLPLFFAGVGLTVSVGAFGESLAAWLMFALVLVVAMASKFTGAWLGARLAGLNRAEASQVGVLMNCRGVTEIVIATVGWQAGFLSVSGLTVLVLVALITTICTGPLLQVIERQREAPSLISN